MDHIAFLSQLSDEDRRQLTTKSNQAGLVHLLAFWGLTLALGVFVFWQIPYWPFLLLPLGILLIFNFSLLHETVHQTPFHSPKINLVVGRIASLIVFLPYEWFRFFHLAHHKHTNDPENDPELGTPKPQNWKEYAIYLSGVPIWQANAKLLAQNALGKNAHNYIPNSAKSRITTEARLMLLFYAGVIAAIAAGHTWLLTCWIIPVIIGQPLLRLYLLAEHGLCPPVANMFENTRTTRTGTIIRFLAWNMPYHAEHHAYPAVPFYNLPKLNQLVEHHLKSVSDGYVAFHKDYQRGLSPENL